MWRQNSSIQPTKSTRASKSSWRKWVRWMPCLFSARANIYAKDEGLVKVNATMSQIPTYVTAVPNGKEKVSQKAGREIPLLKVSRACILQSTLGVPIFESAPSISTETRHSP